MCSLLGWPFGRLIGGGWWMNYQSVVVVVTTATMFGKQVEARWNIEGLIGIYRGKRLRVRGKARPGKARQSKAR